MRYDLIVDEIFILNGTLEEVLKETEHALINGAKSVRILKTDSIVRVKGEIHE